MKLALPKAATSQTILIFIQNSSSTTGAGLTGLVFNSAGLTAYYDRPRAAAVAITLATQTVTGAFSSGGFVEIDATNMPGVYRFDPPDAALATGVDSVVFLLKGATNMAPLAIEVQLTNLNLNDGVRAGLTALPNAAAEAAGGLYTRGTGAGQINQDANGRIDGNVVAWIGTAAATPTVAGVPEVDVTHWIGTAAATPTVAGVPEVDITHWKGSVPRSLEATDRIPANISAISGTVAAATTLEALLAGYITGTADSGSTTTAVDAARTEADNDYWKGSLILFTSGTIAGQCRLITGFTAATDTITFAPATTQAVGTNAYVLIPAGRADLQLWLGTVVNALIAGRVDANTQAMAAGVIAAATFAAGAIDATAIANGAIDAATFAAGAIDAAAIANAAIDAATFAAGAIDAAALAADAANEIRDAVWAQAMTEPTAVPAVTASLKAALEFLLVLARNKITQTATTQLLRNDADAATIGTSTLSDDGTTFIRGEFV